MHNAEYGIQLKPKYELYVFTEDELVKHFTPILKAVTGVDLGVTLGCAEEGNPDLSVQFYPDLESMEDENEASRIITAIKTGLGVDHDECYQLATALVEELTGTSDALSVVSVDRNNEILEIGIRVPYGYLPDIKVPNYAPTELADALGERIEDMVESHLEGWGERYERKGLEEIRIDLYVNHDLSIEFDKIQDEIGRSLTDEERDLVKGFFNEHVIREIINKRSL